jgi:hypothetical protein
LGRGGYFSAFALGAQRALPVEVRSSEGLGRITAGAET